MAKHEFKVDKVADSVRLDTLLRSKYKQYSRSYFQKLIESGLVLVNDQTIKSSHKVNTGDKVIIDFCQRDTGQLPQAEEIPLNIIYEDDDVIVVNKQPGLVVHPAAGNIKGTLVNALIAHFPNITKVVHDRSNELSIIRPGLVHRLDKDTSGVMIVAKNARAMHSLSRQIQNRQVKKRYLALCFGWPKEEQGRVESFLGRHLKDRKKIANVGQEKGKLAITNYQVLQYLRNNSDHYSLVRFDIETGRTHQIRVHAKDSGYPILGDATYSSKASKDASQKLGIRRQMLHAEELEIYLPGDKKISKFFAPIPVDFNRILDKLAKQRE